MRLLSFIIPSFLVVSFVNLASGQVATGHYDHGTFDSLGPETINVGNLNLMLTLPVLHKAGRSGMDFIYDLSYNGAIWTPGSAWTPAVNWGWQQVQPYNGFLHLTKVTRTCTGIDGGHPTYRQTSKVFYTDTEGRNHPFLGGIRDSDENCSGDSDTLSNTWSIDKKYFIGDQASGFPISDLSGNVVLPHRRPHRPRLPLLTTTEIQSAQMATVISPTLPVG